MISFPKKVSIEFDRRMISLLRGILGLSKKDKSNLFKYIEFENDLEKYLKHYRSLIISPEQEEEIEVAEKIHEKFCHDHKKCSWLFEEWENPGYTKTRYWLYAKDLMKFCTKEDAIKLLDHIDSLDYFS